jgi:hypothetical protein
MSKRQHACPEQATARRMGSTARATSETRGTPLEKFASDVVQPNLDGMNGFSAKIGSIVPLGRGYFSHDPRHFVPGYDRAVPPGQNTLDGRGFA